MIKPRYPQTDGMIERYVKLYKEHLPQQASGHKMRAPIEVDQ